MGDSDLYLCGFTNIGTVSTTDDDFFVAKLDKATYSQYQDKTITFGGTDTERNGVLMLSQDKMELAVGFEQLSTSTGKVVYYMCKFHIASWDFTSCKTLLTVFDMEPSDFSYSDFFFHGTGDSLFLLFTFVVTTRAGSSTSFRIMQINGEFLGVTATFTKANSGDDHARGLFVSSNNVYLGLSTNSKELRVSSAQTSYLIKYDLSLSGNTCIQLATTTENSL